MTDAGPVHGLDSNAVNESQKGPEGMKGGC